jgi:hypothetical protein
MRRTVRNLLPLAVGLATAHATAAFDAADITGPGGFATACVSPDGSGANVPAFDLAPVMGVQGVCTSAAFDDLTAASVSALQSDPAGRANAEARLGLIELGARIQTRPTDGRPRSASNGGFADRIVIESPGAGGMAGQLVALVRVRGLLQAAGTGGVANLMLQPQVDDQNLVHGPGFLSGSGVSSTTQLIYWGATHDSDRGHTALALDEEVRFSLPFVFGQPIEFGIWASVLTDTDYAGDSSDTLADLTPGIQWMGVDGAWIEGTRFTTSLSIKSGSGVDWMQPVPEPGTAVLAALGAWVLGLCAGPGRRRQGARLPSSNPRRG